MTNRPTDAERTEAHDEFDLPLDALMAEVAREAAQEAALPGRTPVSPGHGRFEKQRRPSRGPAAAPESAPSEQAEEDDEAPPPPRKRWPKAARAALFALLVLVTLACAFAIGLDRYFHYHAERGKSQMVLTHDNLSLAISDEVKQVTAAEDGKTVKFQGHSYRLNENLATILFMGIDRDSVDDGEYGHSGQADTILLIAMDVETGETRILNISRDSYVEFTLYSGSGQELGLVSRQICLAYAYGDGEASSCENMIAAVSKLLYGLPIEKYMALDMDGVIAANDALGGITLVSPETIRLTNGKYAVEGQEVTLLGADCERYLRTRDYDSMEANGARMVRQKQYLTAFAAALTQRAKADFGFISALYEKLTPYMVTNLDLSDTIFLAQTYLEHRSTFEFCSIDGTYDWLEYDGNRNAVYYLDSDSLFEAVLSVFYTQVD